MSIELSFYPEMTDKANMEIQALKQDIARLRAENDEYYKTIEAIEKSNPSWNEEPEDRNEIRFYRGAIQTNDAQIKADEDRIAELEEEIRGISGIAPTGIDR